ncbi:MAG: efflux RND transporter permease subunit [Thiohalospira sp.]
MGAGLIRASLNNRLLVLVAALVLLVGGGWSALNSSVEVFPDLTAPTVTILAEAHGLPPEEVERQVTRPIEAAVSGTAGVRRVRTGSAVGLAVIDVDFDWETPLHRARQRVAERLQTARSHLPAELPPPEIAPITSIMGEVMFIALHADDAAGVDEMALKTAADWHVRPRLQAVSGVASVLPIGGETRQFQVVARPERLAAHEVGLSELRRAVAESSHNAGGGFLSENGQEFLIQGFGRVDSGAELGEAVVTRRGGEPVRVADLAEVRVGPALRRGTAAYNGDSAVVIGIQKQPGVNTLELTRELDRSIATIEESLPDGMRIATDAFRQADFITVAIDNLNRALRDGAILVAIITFLFLLSWRATAITLVAIPLSLLVAVLGVRWLGGSLNTMTLGGMAIALGVLVDDAIIVVENVIRRLRENGARPGSEQLNPGQVVFRATREMQNAIVFATVIILLVFVPLLFLDGVEGRLLQPLGLAYVVALVASLLVAMTITPVLCRLALPGSRAVCSGHDSRFIAWLKRHYRALLEVALRHWRSVLGGALALLVLAVVALASAGRGFLPDFNEGSLSIGVVTVPGTALERSDRIGGRVERILIEQPEVVATARRTGRSELDPHAQEVFASEIDVTLAPELGDPSELLATLRREFAGIPGTNVTIGQPISHRIDHMLSGTRAAIAIKVRGDDLRELERLGRAVEERVAGVPGAVDVALDEQSAIPFVRVDFDRTALADHGVTMATAARALETALAGTSVATIREGEARFDVVVRYPESVRHDLESVRRTLLTLPSGAHVPLEALADIRRDRGPNRISREDGQRQRVVGVNVAGRDLVGVVSDIRAAVAADVELPPGYHVEYGGQFERMAAANQRLLWLGAGVVAAIFVLLVAAFRSARDAGLVMLNLPLALIGGVAAVWFTSGVVTIAAIIGFITLFGIATRNGLILVDHIGRLIRERGLDVEAAVRRGAEERLVPILMTALATALALVPLALAAGEPGSEIQAPMAVVILWGLISSTLLNMVVVPVAYRRFGRPGGERDAEVV